LRGERFKRGREEFNAEDAESAEVAEKRKAAGTRD
jgi:hypothetical protein